MRRYTTTIHRFPLPFDEAQVADFRLTYVQDGEIVLEKTKADMTVKGKVWSIKLTQQETARFAVGYAVAQIRLLTTEGDAPASNDMRFYVSGVYNEEVLE